MPVRLFGLGGEEKFREYVMTPFRTEHREEVLEAWLEANPESIVEEGKVLIIGRQVQTNLGGFIDLLALDRAGNVVIVELKRGRTPRDTLAQALEYASFAASLDLEQLAGVQRSYLGDEGADVVRDHGAYFELEPEDKVAFNKDQRIVIVGEDITQEIRQTAKFLRTKELPVTCLEFSFFQAGSGERLLSIDMVVGKEPLGGSQVSSETRRRITEEEFFASLDRHGAPVFRRILQHAKDRSCPIHWGSRGFSINVDIDGTHLPLCFGLPGSIYTFMVGSGGLLGKSAVPEDSIRAAITEAKAGELFQAAGRELKCLVNREFSEREIVALLEWLERTRELVCQHGVRNKVDER